MKNNKRAPVSIIIIIIMLIMVVLGVRWVMTVNGVSTWHVSGSSMSPAYENGDFLITSNRDVPNRITNGTVIIAKKPDSWKQNHDDGSITIVKRIIAMPGQTVTLEAGGRLGVTQSNGEQVPSYDMYPLEHQLDPMECDTGTEPSMTIPNGYVLVRGDNVNRSYDSRWAWCHAEDPLVPIQDIQGVILFDIPFGSWMNRLTGNH